MIQHVNKEEMFAWTRAGITYYEEYFGQKYAFAKYD